MGRASGSGGAEITGSRAGSRQRELCGRGIGKQGREVLVFRPVCGSVEEKAVGPAKKGVEWLYTR